MTDIIYYKNNKTKTASQILKYVVTANEEPSRYGTDVSISFKFYNDLRYGDGGTVRKLLEELLEERYKREFFITFNPYVSTDGYTLHIEWN